MQIKSEDLSKLVDFIPELSPMLSVRFTVFKGVRLYGPIGRRGLAQKLNLTERTIRNESTFLKEKGYIEFSAEGMQMTEDGIAILKSLKKLFRVQAGDAELERTLAKMLGIKALIIASSDDEDEAALSDMGVVCRNRIIEKIDKIKVLGITGGSTMAAVVKEFESVSIKMPNLQVVPARGGLGTATRQQANALAETLAGYLDSDFERLYMTDSLSDKSIKQLKKEPEFKKALDQIDCIDTLIFGVGTAQSLAERRGIDHARIEEMLNKGAVAEAFGYYFTMDGEIVDEISTLGITLEKVNSLKRIFAVARGKNKAQAIIAVSKLNPNMVVITDVQTANAILRLESQKTSL